jgi:hypothetical protein
MNICTTSMVRAPLHELEPFVNYHLNVGIDHMFLLFDDPQDSAIDHFSKMSNITCIRCDEAYWDGHPKEKVNMFVYRQRRNANYAFSLAKKMCFDWIIHIDADELIHYENGNIKEELSKKNEIDGIIYKPLECVHSKESYNNIFKEIDTFKNRSCMERKLHIYHLKRLLASMLFCKKIFKLGFYKAHIEGKSATRISNTIRAIGIHKPEPKKENSFLKLKYSKNGFLLHYDCCGYESWKKKWIMRHDGTCYLKGMSNRRRQQFNQFVEIYQKGNEQLLNELFRELYFVTPYERSILNTLGLIKTIHLAPELFQRS